VDTGDNYLTLLDAAEYLKGIGHKISVQTLRRRIKENKLNALIELDKHGPTYKVTTQALLTMLNPDQEQCSDPTQIQPEQCSNLPVPTIDAYTAITLLNKMIMVDQGYHTLLDRVDLQEKQIEDLKRELEEIKRPWWKRWFKK